MQTLPIQLPDQLSAIAQIIRQDWKNIYFGAVPYLQAMYSLNSVQDNYGADSAKSIVLYFLANAKAWRGDTARAVKKHLQQIIKAAR
ncbi:MAG: hypothetical protein J0I32_23370 [Sphingobacteriales bacterium]|nr:hypothetical protein [Sphingobacteriales bacterium]OJW01981.1 MAG: hypothetical protein BGO52_00420 [Sphingobacteriales bacterium 44-61]